MAYRDESVLVRTEEDRLWYPTFADYTPYFPQLAERARFLFSIDELNYFLVAGDELAPQPGWAFVNTERFRRENEHWRAFAGALGWQLHSWYRDNIYCSRCRQPLQDSTKERMLFCPDCGLNVYPTIHPCVIVGVYDGEKLLLTQYANRLQNRYALVAGFNEVGESLEQTVRREVLEEVGLRVKNISFYKSQPWPFSDSLLAGFFAELEGPNNIALDKEELAAAVWIPRRDVPLPYNNLSLTGEMIAVFRKGDWRAD